MNAEELLLEEWKQNVALYIDQDKRGLDRIRIFLTVQAGLFALYGLLMKPYVEARLLFLISVVGIFLTIITYYMGKRAHAYVLMRKGQCMFIEKKLKEIFAPNKQWRTSSGIITTFTREHVSFEKKEPADKDWKCLLKEIHDMGSFFAAPYFSQGKFRWSLKHLRWLQLMHWALGILWIFLSGYAYFLIKDC